MFLEFAQRVAAYGFLGLLIEVIFTGVHSLFVGNKSARGTTFLWMWFVWGSGGVLLESICEWTETTPNLWWHVLLRALVLTIAIYFTEFFWGLFFEKWSFTKRCPWKYTDPASQEQIHRFSVMGFIRLDYAPFWYLLALGVSTWGLKMKSLINVISRL